MIKREDDNDDESKAREKMWEADSTMDESGA